MFEQGKKTFLIGALSRLHIEAEEDVSDLIPLNFLQYLNTYISITIINMSHKAYTSIKENNKNK